MSIRERIASWFSWRVEVPQQKRDSVQAILEDLVYLNSVHQHELNAIKRRARALSEAQPDHIGDFALTASAMESMKASLALDKAAAHARRTLRLYQTGEDERARAAQGVKR